MIATKSGTAMPGLELRSVLVEDILLFHFLPLNLFRIALDKLPLILAINATSAAGKAVKNCKAWPGPVMLNFPFPIAIGMATVRLIPKRSLTLALATYLQPWVALRGCR